MPTRLDFDSTQMSSTSPHKMVSHFYVFSSRIFIGFLVRMIALILSHDLYNFEV